jgi:predicted Zn-dependent peptidase
MAVALYGPSHPYGFTELGTEGSKQGDHARRHAEVLGAEFVPNNAALIVSGQISAADLRPLVEKAFRRLGRAGTPCAACARRAGDHQRTRRARRQAGRSADSGARGLVRRCPRHP